MYSEGILQEIISITVKEYCRKSSISQWRNTAGNHQNDSEGILQEIITITVQEYCKKPSISHWRNTAGNHQYHSKGILQKIITIAVNEYCKKSSISQLRNIAGIINIIMIHTIQSVPSPVARWVFSSLGLLSAWILAICARFCSFILRTCCRQRVQHLPISICDTKYRKYIII